MKKNIFLLSIIIINLFIFNCTLPIFNSKNTQANNVNNNNTINTIIDLKLAQFIAETSIQQTINEKNTKWDKSSKIAGYYPIYTPGINGPAYYEFKVKTNDIDSGYILVSTTKADIQIPELSMEGSTLTEKYQQATSIKELKILRYDFFTSAAELPESSTKNNESSLVATMGFNGNGLIVLNDINKSSSNNTKSLVDDYNNMKDEYANKVINNGCLPIYNKEKLDKYYNEAEQKSKSNIQLPVVKADSDELNYSYPNGWHLPEWTQPNCFAHGYPVGCGPTAWALVYAYWCSFKGNINLFGGQILSDKYMREASYKWKGPGIVSADRGIQWGLPDDLIIKEMEKIHDYCGTIHGDWPYRYGLTWPARMPDAVQYGKNYGYSDTTITTHTITWDWTGGMNFIWNEINSDRPLVLYLSTDAGLHYGGIEGIKKRYWSNTGWSTELGLLVNYGWGDTRKWIFAFSDTWQTTTACFDVYSITRMSAPTNHPPMASNVYISGTPLAGYTLTGTYSYFDPENHQEANSIYQWYSCDAETGSYVPISGANDKTLQMILSYESKWIKFSVIPIDKYGAQGNITYSNPVNKTPPSALNAYISGNNIVGNTLTGNYTYYDSQGHSELGTTYQWYYSDTYFGSYLPIPGANSLNWEINSVYNNLFIKFSVIPKDNLSCIGDVYYSLPLQINNNVPTASNINISGDLQIGNILTGNYSYNDIDGHPEGSSIFQWYYSDTESGTYIVIPGANNRTWTIEFNYHGKWIKFSIMPADSYGGYGEIKYSNPIQTINQAPSANNISLEFRFIPNGMSLIPTLIVHWSYSDPESDPNHSIINWYFENNLIQSGWQEEITLHQFGNYHAEIIPKDNLGAVGVTVYSQNFNFHP